MADRYIICVKPQLSGTVWYGIGPNGTLTVGLITRRSQVQILPPPPTNMQVRAGAQAPALCLSGPTSNGSSNARSAGALARPYHHHMTHTPAAIDVGVPPYAIALAELGRAGRLVIYAGAGLS